MRRKRTSPDRYNYEDTFVKSIEDLEEKQVEEMLQEGRIKCAYASKTIKAGAKMEIEIYPEFTRKQVREYGLPKNRQAQKNLDDRNARKYLERIINANFTEGDIWATLTYSPANLPASVEEAERNMQNYIRRINAERKKQGLPNAKYVYITEYSDEKKIRCHHHILIDGALSMDVLEKKWKKGSRNNMRRVSVDEEGLAGLASYLTKDPKGKKRWKASKGLRKPAIRKSHRVFKEKNIRDMVSGKAEIKEITEKKYRRYLYKGHEVRYNEINGMFYIYVCMRERSAGACQGKRPGKKGGKGRRKK